MLNFNGDPFGFNENSDDSMEPIEKKPVHLILLETIKELAQKPKPHEKKPKEIWDNSDDDEEFVVDIESLRAALPFPDGITDEQIMEMFKNSDGVETVKDIENVLEEERLFKENVFKMLNISFEILQKMIIAEEYQGEICMFLEEIQNNQGDLSDDIKVRNLILLQQPLNIALAGDQPWHQIALDILRREFQALKPDEQMDMMVVNTITVLFSKTEITDKESEEIVLALQKIRKDFKTKAIIDSFIKYAIWDLTGIQGE